MYPDLTFFTQQTTFGSMSFLVTNDGLIWRNTNK